MSTIAITFALLFIGCSVIWSLPGAPSRVYTTTYVLVIACFLIAAIAALSRLWSLA